MIGTNKTVGRKLEILTGTGGPPRIFLLPHGTVHIGRVSRTSFNRTLFFWKAHPVCYYLLIASMCSVRLTEEVVDDNLVIHFVIERRMKSRNEFVFVGRIAV